MEQLTTDSRIANGDCLELIRRLPHNLVFMCRFGH